MDELIDLHLHTIYSDGHWLTRPLFDALVERRIAIAAVMDHDQFLHLPEALALGVECGVTVLPGTEVTSQWRGTSPHILCYAPPATGFTSDALRMVTDRIRATMLANTTIIYQALVARGYSFPRQSDILAEQGGEPVRAGDVGRLLRESGHATTPAEAMALVYEAGYEQATAPLAEVVEAAHASGAVCILAHPGRAAGEIHRYEPDEIERMLADIPLDGIEVNYPTHTPDQVAAYAALAQRHNLLVSAGSDSHGPRQRLPIAYPAANAASLLTRLGLAAG
ncbi:MAG TPA: PHP domain-containing protein [Ktedonobacterales bacterium]